MSEHPPHVQESLEAFDAGRGRDTLAILVSAARDYRDDPDFRTRLEADPRGVLAERNLHITPADAEVRLCVNTPDVFHLTFDENPNAALSDSLLHAVAGGGTASSAGTVGSVSTVGSFLSCVGSGGSVSSAGSGGSATGD